MEYVGAFEAKTKLSELLTRVEEGETITITRHGKAIARLVPENPPEEKMSVEQAIATLREMQKKYRATQAELKEWVNEGRKY